MTQRQTSTAAPAQEAAPSLLIPMIPKTDVLRRVALQRGATTADLKQQWRELFGAEPPAFSRSFLQSRLGHRVQELAFGGLKAETVSRLEALGERLDGGNVVLRGSKLMTARSPERDWCGNIGALSTS